eukprot:648087-Amphidinium_carterae.1
MKLTVVVELQVCEEPRLSRKPRCCCTSLQIVRAFLEWGVVVPPIAWQEDDSTVKAAEAAVKAAEGAAAKAAQALAKTNAAADPKSEDFREACDLT